LAEAVASGSSCKNLVLVTFQVAHGSVFTDLLCYPYSVTPEDWYCTTEHPLRSVGRRTWLCVFDPKADGCPDLKDPQKFKEFLQDKYEKKKWLPTPHNLVLRHYHCPLPNQILHGQPPPPPGTQTAKRWK
ncbi:hypothetical protein XENORESO_008588, partial [Xenotaenia resolanae]